MGRVTYENYARRVAAGAPPTQAAGRYSRQANAERRIVPDVLEKLDLHPNDHLLEIGSGTGNLLIPLSFFVEHTAAVDHPVVLSELNDRFPSTIQTIPGNFLDLQINDTFDKILVYSVLHCLGDEEEAQLLLKKALALLKSGGRMLVGDLPNADKKHRFLTSQTGQQFEQAWKAAAGADETNRNTYVLEQDPDLFSPDDESISSIVTMIRNEGYDAFLVPQDPCLPFGYTREDILVVAP